MIIDRDEDMWRCFYHFFIDVHSTVPAANIEIFMDSSCYKNCSFNSQELTLPMH